VGAIEERITAATKWLTDLEKLVDTDYSGPVVNKLLRQFVDKVELQIERVQWGKTGKRFKCNLVGGTVFFKLNGLPAGFGGLVQSGPPFITRPTTETIAIRWGICVAA